MVFHLCFFGTCLFLALVCFWHLFVFGTCLFLAHVCFFLDAHTSDFTIYVCLKISL